MGSICRSVGVRVFPPLRLWLERARRVGTSPWSCGCDVSSDSCLLSPLTTYFSPPTPHLHICSHLVQTMPNLSASTIEWFAIASSLLAASSMRRTPTQSFRPSCTCGRRIPLVPSPCTSTFPAPSSARVWLSMIYFSRSAMTARLPPSTLDCARAWAPFSLALVPRAVAAPCRILVSFSSGLVWKVPSRDRPPTLRWR